MQADAARGARNVSAAAATLERSAASLGFRGAVERESTIVRSPVVLVCCCESPASALVVPWSHTPK